jgi:hypothetical protein
LLLVVLSEKTSNEGRKSTYKAINSRHRSVPIKSRCSYRGIDIKFNRVKYGLHELNVQCRFVKVRGDSAIVKQVIGRAVDDGNASDSDSSGIVISSGDYITLEGPRVYLVHEVTEEGMVRCVSPANAVNEPITITMDEAMVAWLRQCS